METIIFKAPNGTKQKLREIDPNLSRLLREETARLIKRRHSGSAYEKASHLCGSLKGPGVPADLSTSKDYLKQYAKKSAN